MPFIAARIARPPCSGRRLNRAQLELTMNKVMLHALVCALLAAASLRAEETKKPADGEKKPADGPKMDLKTDKDIASFALGLNFGAGVKGQLVKDELDSSIDYPSLVSGFKETLEGKDTKTPPDELAKFQTQLQELAKKKKAGDKTAVLENKTAISSLFGHNIGQRLVIAREVLNVDLTVQGFTMGTKGETGGFDVAANEATIEKYMKTAQETIQQNAMAKAKELAPKNQKLGDDFLAENKKKEGVITTASGLQYKIIKAGTGEIPKATDAVNAIYEGRLIDGKVFDSTKQHGTPSDNFPVGGVIPGWTEALKLMPVGSKWELYIPGSLAYGDAGSPPDIQPGQLLIFTIELVSIDKAAAPAPQLLPTTPKEAPKDAPKEPLKETK
jgi:FKBP-type peptidyl-prolyl cis-trans isomerase